MSKFGQIEFFGGVLKKNSSLFWIRKQGIWIILPYIIYKAIDILFVSKCF